MAEAVWEMQAEEPEDHLGMTPEQWAQFKAFTSGFGDQDENGVDLSLLRDNLKLTPTERVEKMLRHFPNTRAILQALQINDVRFVVVGNVAMATFDVEYAMDAIDIAYARDDRNIGVLVNALQPFCPRLRDVHGDLSFLWNEQILRLAANMTLQTAIMPVRIIGAIPGIDSFEGVWERSIVKDLYGLQVHVASIDDLISMKRAANRPKDQGHLVELLVLKKLIAVESNDEKGE